MSNDRSDSKAFQDQRRLADEVSAYRGDGRTAFDLGRVFEHGFLDFSEMHKPASEVILKTASYLRRAIIELLKIDPALQERAFSSDYAKPRGPLIVVRQLFGTLLGKVDALAMAGEQYPHVTWTSKIKNVSMNANGRFSFTPIESGTAKIGEGIKLAVSRFEAWDGSTINETTAPAGLPRAPHEV